MALQSRQKINSTYLDKRGLGTNFYLSTNWCNTSSVTNWCCRQRGRSTVAQLVSTAHTGTLQNVLICLQTDRD